MKKILLAGLMALVLVLVSSDEMYAQSKKRKKKKSPSRTTQTTKTRKDREKDQNPDENNRGSFADRLWYGGNFTLGFSGGNNQSFFAFGLAPMVGYKIIDDIVSVGPRLGFEYNHVRVQGPGQVFKASPVSWSAGAFARLKPVRNFFAHFEYEYQSAESTDPNGDGFVEIDFATGKIVTQRIPFDNVYIGAGYNSGGQMGYEILLLYNLNHPDNTIAPPFNLRFGFTYKF